MPAKITICKSWCVISYFFTKLVLLVLGFKSFDAFLINSNKKSKNWMKYLFDSAWFFNSPQLLCDQ